MTVIDFRVRPPLPSFRDHIIYTKYPAMDAANPADIGVLFRDRGEARSALEYSMELFFEEWERCGADYGLIMGRSAGPTYGVASNEEIAEFCAEHTQFRAFAGVDGNDLEGSLSTVRWAAEQGMRGIAFDNGWVGLHQDDDTLWPIYDAVAERGMILALTASQLMGPDLTWSHPDRLRVVAKRYPETPLVVTHGAWPWTKEVCALAYDCANVYVMPDCYLNTRAPGTDEYVAAANATISDRILYGSAYPIRPLKQSLDTFRTLSLTDEAMENALWRNAARLLDWEITA